MFNNLLDGCESFIAISKCDSCDDEFLEKKICTSLPLCQILWINNYENSESELNKYFSSQLNLHCLVCKNNSKKVTFELGSYLVIDIEIAYEKSNLAKKTYNIDTSNIQTDLNDLPTVLVIKDKKIILVGVIGYLRHVQHYVAYCRSLKGSLQKRNDLCKERQYLKKSEKVLIHSLVYVHCAL